MNFLSETDVAHLEVHAKNIRKTVIEMLASAGSGHTAGPLGMADIFAALYFYILKHNPEDPAWDERDRLILSNGHIAPVRYAAMALSGYFPIEDIHTFRKFGSSLQGHPERTHLPGVETTSGPLGEGLSQAVGIALGARMDKRPFRTYCIMSDGEQQSGLVWEAAMLAGKEKLSNLIAIIDRNNIQISGETEDVMPLEPIREKYEAFNWHVVLVDGNDVEAFCDALMQTKHVEDKPSVLVAHTVPGKGIKEIEGKYEWHGKVPSESEAKKWIKELT
jgi:transketolase